MVSNTKVLRFLGAIITQYLKWKTNSVSINKKVVLPETAQEVQPAPDGSSALHYCR